MCQPHEWMVERGRGHRFQREACPFKIENAVLRADGPRPPANTVWTHGYFANGGDYNPKPVATTDPQAVPRGNEVSLIERF